MIASVVTLVALGVLLWQQVRERCGGISTNESRLETWGSWTLFDLAFVALAFDALPRLLTGLPWSAAALALLLAWRLLLLVLLRPWIQGSRLARAITARIGGHLLFAIGASWAVRAVGGNFTLELAWTGVIAHIILIFGYLLWRIWRQRCTTLSAGDDCRLALLLVTALALTGPWMSPYLVGTGDGILYYETLQEFLNQLKAGIFPPLVSQSEIAPFGAVFPFRFATYHYYFCALLDVLTGHHLSTYGLQHLTLLLSFVAGGWSMYGVLRRIVPAHLGLVWTFATLYLLSPAWLGPLYGFTMIFTIMALPFIPVALAGTWPTLGARGVSAAVAHGALLAATWHAHLPVGFWTSIACGLAQVVGWITLRPGWRIFGRQLLAWGVCILLCSGLWWSILALRLTMPHEESTAGVDLLLRMVRDAFPGSVLPATKLPAALSDIQLGYALLGSTILSALAFRRQKLILIWLLPATLFLVLILPVPKLTELLWRSIPTAAVDFTGAWPMQRLIGPLAAATAITGALAFQQLMSRSRLWQRIIPLLLVIMLIWSAAEAGKYLRRGASTIQPGVLSDYLSRRENSPLLINWLAFHNHPVPAVLLTQGTYDLRLFNRIRGEDKTTIIADNYQRILDDAAKSPPIPIKTQPLAPGLWRLQPPFEFLGGKHYLLQFLPNARTPKGTLVVTSGGFARPPSVLGPNAEPVVLPAWKSTDDNTVGEMVYTPERPELANQVIENVMAYRVIPYEMAQLPVAIERYAPYQARVTAPQSGWLETHRLFTEGYRAVVNGKPAEVAKTGDGWLMIRVPAGVSQVQLDFEGLPSVRYGIWAMMLAWGAVILWGLAHLLAFLWPTARPAGI